MSLSKPVREANYGALLQALDKVQSDQGETRAQGRQGSSQTARKEASVGGRLQQNILGFDQALIVEDANGTPTRVSIIINYLQKGGRFNGETAILNDLINTNAVLASLQDVDQSRQSRGIDSAHQLLIKLECCILSRLFEPTDSSKEEIGVRRMLREMKEWNNTKEEIKFESISEDACLAILKWHGTRRELKVTWQDADGTDHSIGQPHNCWATVRHLQTAISHFHRLARKESPTEYESVKRYMKGLKDSYVANSAGSFLAEEFLENMWREVWNGDRRTTNLSAMDSTASSFPSSKETAPEKNENVCIVDGRLQGTAEGDLHRQNLERGKSEVGGFLDPSIKRFVACIPINLSTEVHLAPPAVLFDVSVERFWTVIASDSERTSETKPEAGGRFVRITNSTLPACNSISWLDSEDPIFGHYEGVDGR